jgi:hypothetical protein
MRLIARLAVLVPLPALADAGPAGHTHPHGLEGILLALTLACVAWAVWRMAH